MNPPTFASVLQARTRLAGRILETPLVESTWLSSAAGARVWLKLECLQHTRSFKIRGALNAVMATIERAPGSHVVTASAGNHGLALAHAARMSGLPCTIFTPANAARTKLDAIRSTGANLNAVAHDYDEAEGLAKAYARQEHAEFISPYDHRDVIAGGGTIALEIAESNLEPDVIVVPVGGGGLISGIATVAKAIAPRSRVVGVEAAVNPAFATAHAHGGPMAIPVRETLADGLGGNFDPESITLHDQSGPVTTRRASGLGDPAVSRLRSGRSQLDAAGQAAPGVVEQIDHRLRDVVRRELPIGRPCVAIGKPRIDRSRQHHADTDSRLSHFLHQCVRERVECRLGR
jgi:threonine dehydratase